MSKLINFYSKIKQAKVHNPNYESHLIELPFRMLVCCSSGSGKTNYILNLLYHMDSTFHRLIIITKAAEPLYGLLEDKLKNRVEIHYEGKVPEFEKLEQGYNGLIIFDDMVLTPNQKIGEIFIRGRKLGYSSIYISQSFFGTPKLIRQNVNYVALGKGINRRDLRLILSEYSISMSIDELERVYFTFTREPMNFALLDLVKNNLRQNIKDNIIQN
jgi:Poxvirus A32 protein